MEPSDWIALGAFLLSGFAVWRAERASRMTTRLQRFQVREYEERERQRNRAKIEVSVASGGRPSDVYLKLTNRGRGPASNVRVEIEPKGGRSGRVPFLPGEAEKLPLSELPAGDTLVLGLAPTMGDAVEYVTEVRWQNLDGKEQRITRHINITAI